MIKFVLAAAMLAALSAPAVAQVPVQPAKPMPAAEDTFMKHDADRDGALTIGEVKAADPKATQEDFDHYDSDKSQSLSKEEFAKWVEAKTTLPASAPG